MVFWQEKARYCKHAMHVFEKLKVISTLCHWHHASQTCSKNVFAAYCVALASALLFVSVCTGQVTSKQGKVDAAQLALLEKKIAPLVKEAKGLSNLKSRKLTVTRTRPHPALAGLRYDMTPVILKRMKKPFTGNGYMDAYIRWHLLYLVTHGRKQHLKGLGLSFKSLIEQVPGDINKPSRPEYRDEPPEISAKWHQLLARTRAIVGIPPFEKRYHPPDSFKFFTADKLAQAKSDYAQMQVLRKQWRRVHDYEAINYNKRIRVVNWAVRQYRGELIQALLWTGNPKMFEKVIDAIDQHARAKRGIALDLLNHCYIAGTDGVFLLYDNKLRIKMGKKLKATTMANDVWIQHGGQKRNFADYAYHLVHILIDDADYDAAQQYQKKEGR